MTPSNKTDYKLERKKILFTILGPTCEKCGENDLRLLELHHTEGDGSQERVNWQSDLFYYLIGSILHDHKRYATLCTHCHRLIHRKDKGADGPLVISEDERERTLLRWEDRLREVKDPPEVIKEWLKSHPREG